MTRVSILDRRGEEALGKPVGTYVTLTLDGLARREENAFGRAARAVAAELGELLGFLHPEAPVLVVGLGNRAITPDAVGPKVHEYTLVTRHLVRQVPEHFGDLRPVASLSAGVLGTTGMESGGTGPGSVGAAAARLRDRGGRAGLPVPKTGVPHGAAGGYRHRPGLWGGQPPGCAGPGFPGGAGDCGGVPTVVDGATLAADLLGTEELPPLGEGRDLMVTPKDIDSQVADLSKVIGYGIDLALQPSLTLEDLDLLLS